MTLRNQISAAVGIPQKRSTAIFRKPMIRHPHSRDSVSVALRTAAQLSVNLTVLARDWGTISGSSSKPRADPAPGGPWLPALPISGRSPLIRASKIETTFDELRTAIGLK